jgi:hypothetical protein
LRRKLLAPSIFATDITGKWYGTVQSSDKYQSYPEAVQFELRQKEDRIVGVRINAAGMLDQLQNGRIAGSRVTFELGDEKFRERVELSLDGDKLFGSLRPVYTGMWTGNMETTINGETRLYPMALVLHQNGAEVRGTTILMGAGWVPDL